MEDVLLLDRIDLKHHADDLSRFGDEGLVDYTLDDPTQPGGSDDL
tara:strand:- start:471 stop:605 length:135 start_codon:yes stop_codon:yes gene_type:complete